MNKADERKLRKARIALRQALKVIDGLIPEPDPQNKREPIFARCPVCKARKRLGSDDKLTNHNRGYDPGQPWCGGSNGPFVPGTRVTASERSKEIEERDAARRVKRDLKAKELAARIARDLPAYVGPPMAPEDLKAIQVHAFNLSIRTRNCLGQDDIQTLWDLTQRRASELLAITNFGAKSLYEVRTLLNMHGCALRDE